VKPCLIPGKRMSDPDAESRGEGKSRESCGGPCRNREGRWIASIDDGGFQSSLIIRPSIHQPITFYL
jgi:hypothetical protein